MTPEGNPNPNKKPLSSAIEKAKSLKKQLAEEKAKKQERQKLELKQQKEKELEEARRRIKEIEDELKVKEGELLLLQESIQNTRGERKEIIDSMRMAVGELLSDEETKELIKENPEVKGEIYAEDEERLAGVKEEERALREKFEVLKKEIEALNEEKNELLPEVQKDDEEKRQKIVDEMNAIADAFKNARNLKWDDFINQNYEKILRKTELKDEFADYLKNRTLLEKLDEQEESLWQKTGEIRNNKERNAFIEENKEYIENFHNELRETYNSMLEKLRDEHPAYGNFIADNVSSIDDFEISIGYNGYEVRFPYKKYNKLVAQVKKKAGEDFENENKKSFLSKAKLFRDKQKEEYERKQRKNSRIEKEYDIFYNTWQDGIEKMIDEIKDILNEKSFRRSDDKLPKAFQTYLSDLSYKSKRIGEYFQEFNRKEVVSEEEDNLLEEFTQLREAINNFEKKVIENK